MVVKLVALMVLGAVTVLAVGPRPEPATGPVQKTGGPNADGPKSAVVGKKAPHGKREVASYGLSHFPPHQQHHSRYSFGGHPQLAELYAPATSHGGYSYSIPQHSPAYPAAYGSHKLFVSPATSSLKYAPVAPGASSHAFFSPHGHYGAFNGFSDGPVKYGSFGSKDLSELLKQLHSTVGPLTIKPVPSSGYGHGYGSFGEHEHVFDSGNALHLKPVTFKLQELPSFHGGPVPQALTAPAGPTSSSSTYGHVTHSLAYEPSYTHGVKGLRHYSTPNVPTGDLYSGNKYVSSLGLGQPSPHGASMVSPLHTSVHSALATQKPFKPSTYLGSSHETISAPSNAHVHTHPPLHAGAYLAPSLQYLPPVNKHPLLPPKLSYDSPAKHGYLPPPPPPSSNAYLPPHGKPTNSYLPPVASGGHSNYIPLAASASESHEETVVRQPVQYHHHQQQQQHQESNESLDYSGTSAAPTPTADTPAGHWKH